MKVMATLHEKGSGESHVFRDASVLITEYDDVMTLSGRQNIARVAKAILETQAIANKGYVKLISPPENSILLDQLLYSFGNRPEVEITQIIALHNRSKNGSFNVYNLQCLRILTPLLFSNCSYNVKCYYDSLPETPTKANILPYLLVTEGHMLTFSGDMETAIYSHRADLVQFFNQVFNDAERETESFVHKGKTVSSLSGDTRSRGFYMDVDTVIQYTIPLASAITPDMIERIALPHVAQRTLLISTIKNFIEYRNEHIKNTEPGYTKIYCTADGINDFITSGRTNELPFELYSPIPISMRIEIIENLIRNVESGFEKLYIIMSEITSIVVPKNIRIMHDKDMGIVISSMRTHPSDRRFSLDERITVNSFLDFLDSISSDEKILKPENSLEFLRLRLFILKDMAIREKEFKEAGL